METKPYANEHACRLNDPSKYDKFRRSNDKFGKGIHAIFGIKADKSEVQSIRFDKKIHSPAQARKWLSDHDYKCIEFEEAKKEQFMETYRIKSAEIQTKDIDEDKGTVQGYASIFGNIDDDNEMIIEGAFKKTIKERGPKAERPRIKHLWQHDIWQPIAAVETLTEDDKGLFFKSRFGNDSFSQDKLQQHIDRIITEMSIGFNVVKRTVENEDDEKTRFSKLLELKLWELSSVTWGANSLTEIVEAKNLSTCDRLERINKRMDRLGTALRNGKYTDETLENFEIELKQIKDFYNSLIEITKPDEKSTPDLTIEPTNEELFSAFRHSINFLNN